MSDEFKEEGNKYFQNNDYESAIQSYTKALDLDPGSAVIYSNRAAVYLKQENWQRALNDAEKAVSLDSTYAKGVLRCGQSLLKLGRLLEAKLRFQAVLDLEPNHSVAMKELKTIDDIEKMVDLGMNSLNAGQYEIAHRYFTEALSRSPASIHIRYLIGNVFLKERRFTEASTIATSILQDDRKNPEGGWLRAMSLAYRGETAQAKNVLRAILEFSPDFEVAKSSFRLINKIEKQKEEGNEFYRRGKYSDAVAAYSNALAVDPDNSTVNSQLLCNRAAARLQIQDYQAAVNDCTEAIKIDHKYVKAYMRRAQAYQKMEKYDESVRDWDAAKNLDPGNDDVKSGLREAQTAKKKADRPDYYRILDVPKNVNDDDLKKAYRRAALKWHPDRHQNDTEEEKAYAEHMFKLSGEANAVLSDPRKRKQYDMGMDLVEIEQGVNPDAGGGMGGFGGMSQSDILQMMFGGRSSPFGGGFGGFGSRGGVSDFGDGGGIRFQFN